MANFFASYPADVAAAATGVTSLNSLTGALTLVGAGGITITPSGSNITITGAASGWSLTGNAGTTPGTNFVGTTDSEALEFKTNSALALTIDTSQNATFVGKNTISIGGANTGSPTFSCLLVNSGAFSINPHTVFESYNNGSGNMALALYLGAALVSNVVTSQLTTATLQLSGSQAFDLAFAAGNVEIFRIIATTGTLGVSSPSYIVAGEFPGRLYSDTNGVELSCNNVLGMTMDSGGNIYVHNILLFITDNTQDIGVSSTVGRPRNVYVGTSIINGSPQTTLTGSAGTAVCSEPERGGSYKKVVIYLSGYTDTGTQTYTYPAAFTHTPYVYGLTAGVAGATATTTTITFTVTTQTGFVFIEGY